MVIHFTKYKFSNSLFYKKLENGSLEILDDRIVVFFSPFSYDYCGTFFIHSKVPNSYGDTKFRTMKNPTGGEANFQMMEMGFGEFFISISYNRNKVSITDRRGFGIILKR